MLGRIAGRTGVLLAIGILKLLALVPYGVTARFGDGLGWLLYQIPSSRKRIVHINLKLCFPEWSQERRNEVAQKHFRHAIRSYVERSVQWFGSEEKLAKLIEVESEVDLLDPDMPPSLMLGYHFVAIEAASVWLNRSLNRRCGSLYQPMSNPVLEEVAKKQDSATMDFFRRTELSGFVDMYYTYNTNTPSKACVTVGGVSGFNCLYNFNVDNIGAY